MVDDLRYEKKLRNAEKFARESEIGLWKKSKSKCNNCIELVELNPEDEYFILRNNCNYECNLRASDEANHLFNVDIDSGEKRIDSKGSVWNDNGDGLFLRDESGLILYYNY